MRLYVLLLVWFLAACGGSPKTNFYALEPLPAAHSMSARRQPSPVTVDHVALPEMLDRLSLVTEGPGNHISVSDTDRWAAPLDEQVRRTLTEDLRQRIPGGSVLTAGDPAPPGARSLTLNVEQFVADPTGEVTLEADWSLHGGKTTDLIHHVRIQTASADPGGNAIASSMSRALAQLADKISSEL